MPDIVKLVKHSWVAQVSIAIISIAVYIYGAIMVEPRWPFGISALISFASLGLIIFMGWKVKKKSWSTAKKLRLMLTADVIFSLAHLGWFIGTIFLLKAEKCEGQACAIVKAGTAMKFIEFLVWAIVAVMVVMQLKGENKKNKAASNGA